MILIAATLWAGAGSARATDPRCPTSATVCLYQLPADVQAAQSACFRAEREARGIPGDRAAYLAWFEANRGTAAQLDWSAAHRACRHRYTQSGGMWNWDALVYVGSR